MAAEAQDLTTVASAHGWLGIGVSVTGDDAVLQELITAISDQAIAHMGRDIKSQAYTRRFDGNGTVRLILPDGPLTAVSSLSIGGVVISAAPDSESSGYLFDEDGITLIGYSFTRGKSNVLVTYTSGYATVPTIVRNAINQQVAFEYKSRSRIGQTSVSMGGQSVSLSTEELLPGVQAKLNAFASVVPG